MWDCFFFSLLGSSFVIFLVCLILGRVRILYCYSAGGRLLFNSTDSCTDSEKNDNGLFLWTKSLWYVNRIKAWNQWGRISCQHIHTHTSDFHVLGKIVFSSWFKLIYYFQCSCVKGNMYASLKRFKGYIFNLQKICMRFLSINQCLHYLLLTILFLHIRMPFQMCLCYCHSHYKTERLLSIF